MRRRRFSFLTALRGPTSVSVLIALGALSACGLRASLAPGEASEDGGAHGSPGSGGKSGADAGTSVYGSPDSGTSLNDDFDAAFACAPGALGQIPPGYEGESRLLAVADPSASYDDVIALEVESGSSSYPAALTGGGAFGLLDTPSVNLSSLVRIGVGLVYYVEASGGGSTLFSVSRQGGKGTVVLAAPDAVITDVAIVGADVWLAVVNSSDSVAAIYPVAGASGGTLGTPFYTAPAGTSLTNLAVTADGSLLWAEAAPVNADLSPNVTVRLSTLDPSVAPTVVATFAANTSLQVASYGSATYFAFPAPIGIPLTRTLIPPPPGGGGGGGGGGANAVSSGLYSVAAGGAPTLVDVSGALPLVRTSAALFYNDSAGLVSIGSGGAINTVVAAVEAPVAFGASASGALYYELSGGCFYKR